MGVNSNWNPRSKKLVMHQVMHRKYAGNKHWKLTESPRVWSCRVHGSCRSKSWRATCGDCACSSSSSTMTSRVTSLLVARCAAAAAMTRRHLSPVPMAAARRRRSAVSVARLSGGACRSATSAGGADLRRCCSSTRCRRSSVAWSPASPARWPSSPLRRISSAAAAAAAAGRPGRIRSHHHWTTRSTDLPALRSSHHLHQSRLSDYYYHPLTPSFHA